MLKLLQVAFSIALLDPVKVIPQPEKIVLKSIIEGGLLTEKNSTVPTLEINQVILFLIGL